MQVSKTRFGFLGALVLGASVLVQGCSNKAASVKSSNEIEYEKTTEAIHSAKAVGDIEYLLNVVNESEYSYFKFKHRVQASNSLVEMFPQNARVILTLAKNVDYGTFETMLLSRLDPSLEVLPELVKLLGDESFSTKLNAMNLIAKIGPRATIAIGPLVKVLNEEDNLFLRFQAVSVLGNINANTKEALLALLNALKKDSDEDVRGKTYKALVKVAPSAIESLIELLKEEKGKDIFLVVKSVGPKTLPYLLRALKVEEDSVNKANICLLLGILGKSNTDETIHSEIMNTLLKSLNNKNKSVRKNTVISLGIIGSRAKEAIKPLEEVSQKDKNDQIRELAVETLGEIRER